MRIAIDYTAAARQGAGIGRYARELVTAILAGADAADYVLMTASAGLGQSWAAEKERLRQIAGNHPLTFRDIPLTDDWMARLWQRLRLPLPAEWITGRADVFYSPDFVLPPLLRRTRAVLTVHDLSFLRYPETFPPALRTYLENAVPRSVARSDAILADSEATRQDLIELLRVPPAKVTTLYCGVASRFTPEPAPGERERLRARYGIGERPYVLAVGTIQPRKNYPHLIAACAPLAKTYNIEVVIAGRPAWLAEPTLEAVKACDYVRLMGFFDDDDLPALYRQAHILAFPSLYEGFGIPPLEAMACGAPVVASTAASVPEVVGNAGLLADPQNISAWTTALERLMNDQDLRAQLRRDGLQRARQFTWEAAARQWAALVGGLTG